MKHDKYIEKDERKQKDQKNGKENICQVTSKVRR